MVTPLLHVPRPGSETSDAAVGAYAFSATLAIQDITGLATSGVSASHIAKRLEPSTESESMLFALVERDALRPVTELGYQELTLDDIPFAIGWVFVSLPLLEDLGVIEANIIYDAQLAPLPGEEWSPEPWASALSLIDDLSAHLARPTRHIWVTHAPGDFVPPGVLEAGYSAAFREDQATFAIEAANALPACETAEFEVVYGPGFAPARAGVPGETEQFCRLLTSASRNYPRGTLQLETIEWDLTRIIDAGARLADRGGAQLTGIARAGGEIVGLCEAVHYSTDDDTVCELGLVYVLPEHRTLGIGASLIRATLERAHEVWEDLEVVYCSYPGGAGPAEAVTRSLGAEVVSSSTAWQKV